MTHSTSSTVAMPIPQLEAEKFHRALAKARWSRRDAAIILASCFGGPALVWTWTLFEPLLNLDIVSVSQLGGVGKCLLIVFVIAAAVTARVLAKARAVEKLVTMLLERPGSRSESERDPLTVADAVSRPMISTLKALGAGTAEVAIEQLLQEWPQPRDCLVFLGALVSQRFVAIKAIGETIVASSVSSVAGDFLLSMAMHAADGAPILGDFGAVETNVGERRRLRELIHTMEAARVDRAVAAGRKPTAGRLQKSALVIVKARFDDEDCVLMQWSESWGRGYFWFIGGIPEAVDAEDLVRCAVRETSEEIGIRPADVRVVGNELFTCRDARVSKRVGLYTEYEYHVFAATLRIGAEAAEILQREWIRECSVRSPRGVVKVPLRLRWRSVRELKSDQLLMEDAGVVVDALSRHIDSIPLQPTP